VIVPDFVLLNYLRVTNIRVAKWLLRQGVLLGVLDTEGGVFEDLQAYSRQLAGSRRLRHRICCFCSWGNALADLAREEGLFASDAIKVTGSPRMDFYCSAWRQAALKNSPRADQVSRPLVLINGTFPVANPLFRTPEEERQMLIKEFGMSPGYVDAWIRSGNQSLREMSSLASTLASKFPAASFVYRPHPFEGMRVYEELLDDRPNLHLLKEGTVDGWILRACAVLHQSCSTAVEAVVSGVPALSPRWVPAFRTVAAIEAVTLHVPSREEMIEAVGQAIEGELQLPARVEEALDGIVADLYGWVDGNSSQRVAEVICRVLRDAPDRGGSGRKAPPAWVHSPFRRRMGNAVRNLLGLAEDFSFRKMRRVPLPQRIPWEHTAKRFTSQQVSDLVVTIRQASDLPEIQVFSAGDGNSSLRSVVLQAE
jgi:surface carbohydrate biosynthesis protein